MSSTAAFELFLIAAIGGLAAVRWRGAIILSLPLLAIFNRLALPIGGSAVRLDQLAACALVVPLAASVLVGVRRLRTDSTVWWLATILALNVVASLANSPARSYSLMQCVNLASAWIIYLLLLNFLDTREARERFLRRVLWAAAIGSGIASAAFLLAVSGLNIGGAEVSASAAENLTKAYGAYGTMEEPNILGSFSAAYFVLAFGLLAAAARQSAAPVRAPLLRWVACLTGVALVLSFTRAAWLATVAGMICVALLGGRTAGRRIKLRWLAARIGMGALLVLVLLVLPGDTGTLFRFKLANLVNVGSQTALQRLITYGMALQQTVEHPLIGWGTFTFAPLVAQGSDFRQFDNWHNLWIGNYLLLALHDTGIVGLGLWIAMLGSIVRRAIRAARLLAPVDVAGASRVVALTGALATILIAFLSTTGFSLGFSWVLIGLLGAYCQQSTVGSIEHAHALDSADGLGTADWVAVPADVSASSATLHAGV